MLGTVLVALQMVLSVPRMNLGLGAFVGTDERKTALMTTKDCREMTRPLNARLEVGTRPKQMMRGIGLQGKRGQPVDSRRKRAHQEERPRQGVSLLRQLGREACLSVHRPRAGPLEARGRGPGGGGR